MTRNLRSLWGLGRHPLTIIVMAGMLLRLLVSQLYPGHWYDVFAFQDWTRQLIQNPIHAFYTGQVDVPQDHLPGDLWLLWLVGQIAHLFDPNVDFYGAQFAQVLRLTAIACDEVLIVSVFVTMRALAGRSAGLVAAAAISMNPAVIFISSVWNQFDALSIALAVLAIGMLVRQRPLWAAGCFTYACLIKPQLGLLIPISIVMELRRRQGGQRLRWRGAGTTLVRARGDVLQGVGVSLSVLLATCLPFGVGLLGIATPWSVLGRIRIAADEYQSTVLGAWNIWTVPIGRNVPPDDVHALVAGFTYRDAGTVLTALGVVGGILIAARVRSMHLAALAGGFVTLWAFFLFATRVHERYMLPALTLAALMAVALPALRWWAAALTVTGTLNLIVAYAWHVTRFGPLSTSFVSQAGSVLNIVLFAGFLLFLSRATWTPWLDRAVDVLRHRSWKAFSPSDLDPDGPAPLG